MNRPTRPPAGTGMVRDENARVLWSEGYAELSEGKPGLLGAMVSRAEAQVMRTAGLYALLDRSKVVRPEHLRAALALWKYAEDSTRYIIGATLGDPDADTILRALLGSPAGLTRTDIRDLFGRNKHRGVIDRALGHLRAQGLARHEMEETGGRPTERWYAVRRNDQRS